MRRHLTADDGLLNQAKPIARYQAWVVLLMLLVACTPTSDITPMPTPRTGLWGAIERIATAETRTAPALLPMPNGMLWVWLGADEASARHYASVTGASPAILALPAAFPSDYSLHPAAGGRAHLLYIDRMGDQNRRLQAAVINNNRIAELGPNAVSDAAVWHYDAQDTGCCGLYVAYSSGSIAEPALFVRRMDGGGRIGFASQVIRNADYPALLALPDGLYLYWLAADGRVGHGRLRDNASGEMEPLTLTDITAVLQSPALQPADYLNSFYVAADQTHRYLIWQILRDSVTPQVWWSSSPLDHDNWSSPQPLGVQVNPNTTVQTGYNSGQVQTAHSVNAQNQPDSLSIQWARPLTGLQHTSVPLAMTTNDALGVLYLQGGDVLGYQQLTPIPPLFDAPRIATDDAYHLYVTWAQPTLNGDTGLWMASTRR